MTKPHYQADLTGIVKGNGCHVIRPKGMNIVWGNDERYWKISKEMDENASAELVQVSWLEVTGSVPLEADGKYKLTFEVELTGDAFGWKDIQPFLMAKVGKKGKYEWRRVKIQAPEQKDEQAGKKFQIPEKSLEPLEITVPADATDKTLHFGLYEVWSGKWKGGLKIYNAKVTRA